MGSVWRAASSVLNAFTTRAPGMRAWISSAPEVPSVARPEPSALDRVGGVHDDLAVERRADLVEHVGDGRVGDRQHDELSSLDGLPV